jgi:hypothetical protein
MTHWSITREWDGQTVAVLASGPSMTQEVAETVRLAGVRTIAVNNQAIPTNGKAAMAPWADILYAADYRWWHFNKDAVMEFKGRRVAIDTQNDRWPRELMEAVVFLRHGGADGFDERPDYIRSGGNSGYQGVHLAIKLGARRVVLCGFDMHSKRGEHWFGSHFWRKGYNSRYDLFLNRFAKGAPELKARADIINTTPGSALKCFPFMSLEDALNGLPIVPQAAAGSQGKTAKEHRGVETLEKAASKAMAGA